MGILTRPLKTLSIPPLVNGDHLSGDEFLRRYEAMPELKKAELIDGVVYIMASPVRAEGHGDEDNLAQGWLCNYGIATPGVRASSNATSRLDYKSIPQPDVSLRYLPERNGNSRVGADGYIHGAPELVVEVSASSVSIDVNKKMEDYRKACVQEYTKALLAGNGARVMAVLRKGLRSKEHAAFVKRVAKC